MYHSSTKPKRLAQTSPLFTLELLLFRSSGYQAAQMSRYKINPLRQRTQATLARARAALYTKSSLRPNHSTRHSRTALTTCWSLANNPGAMHPHMPGHACTAIACTGSSISSRSRTFGCCTLSTAFDPPAPVLVASWHGAWGSGGLLSSSSHSGS